MAAKFRMLHVLSRRILIFTNAAARPVAAGDSMAERAQHERTERIRMDRCHSSRARESLSQISFTISQISYKILRHGELPRHSKPILSVPFDR